MRKYLIALFLLGCGGPTVGPEAPRVEGPATAFVDVAVVPMTSERVMEHQTVIVRGDRVLSIAPKDALPLPGDARVIDGRGKYLMPGLADMHVHLGDEAQLTLSVAYGVTTVRNMWGMPMHLAWRKRIAAGELLGPRIFTTGPITDGTPPIWDGSRVVTTAAEARAAVAEDKAAGYDMIKVYNRLTPEAYDALVAAAKEAGLPIVGHTPDAVGLAHVLASGQKTIEHLTGWSAALQKGGAIVPPVEIAARQRMVDSIDEAAIPALVEATKKAGTWNCPTMTVKRNINTSDDERRALAARPEMRYVPAMAAATWDPKQDFRTKDLVDDPGQRARWRALDVRLVKALSDAGAHLLAGTDLGNPFIIAGKSLHEELELLVAAGLTPYQALRAATTEPADFLGVPGEKGTIEPFQRADLLLLDANPLADVRASERPAGVMVAGRWHERGELDGALDAIAATVNVPPDRFGKLPELDGAVTWSMKYNGAEAGAEKLARKGVDLVGQSVTDPPYFEAMVTSVAGGVLTYEGETQAGKSSLRVTVAGGKAHGELVGADGKKGSQDIEVPAGARLAPATMTGIFAVYGDAAATLEVGASVDIDVATALSGVGMKLLALHAKVTRLPDEADARAYACEVASGEFAMKGKFTILKDNLPGTVEVTLQIGTLTFSRM